MKKLKEDEEEKEKVRYLGLRKFLQNPNLPPLERVQAAYDDLSPNEVRYFYEAEQKKRLEDEANK